MENITRKKVFGRSFILRKRLTHKRPLSYKRGECFHGSLEQCERFLANGGVPSDIDTDIEIIEV